jgi:glycosyltransferase involved in cell wall biosynthesis
MVLDNDFTRDTRVRKEAASLAAAGHAVRIVALRTPGSAAREAAGGVEVVRVRPAGWAGRRGPLHALELLLWYERMAPLGREAERRPADVVHAHDLPTLGPARRAARRLGAALVYDDHELYTEKVGSGWPSGGGRLRRAGYALFTRWLRAAGAACERRWVRGLSGHVTVSDAIADEIARRYGVPRPVVVANCRPFRPPGPGDGRLRRAAGAPPGTRLVLFVGTFPGSGAGHTELVDVLPLLPADVRLVFLGPGWGKEALRRRAGAMGLGDRAAFLPPVPSEEVPAWLADADASVVPNELINLSNLYALPNKLFESMLAGTPVVAGDSPEMRRVLTEFPAGVLYRTGDPGDLAARLREVLDAPPAVRAAWREAGRAAASGPWSWERQAERLVALYDEILAGRKPCTGRC